MATKRPRPNRGVVLLIVLILLMLLIVTGLTFAIISGQFRRAAEASGKKEMVGDDPQQLLERAMSTLVRDVPPDERSSLKGHGLLSDLYGLDSAFGRVTGTTSHVGGQFVEVAFDSGVGLHDLAGHYNGCVFTFGAAEDAAGNTAIRQISSRVVQYDPAGDGTGTLIIEAPEGDEAQQVFPANGSLFVINGRPFNGTGAGYLAQDREGNDRYTLDSTLAIPLPNPSDLTSREPRFPMATGTEPPSTYLAPVALLPNYGRMPTSVLAPTAAEMASDALARPPDFGGLDEPWDAVDYQNMFLAMVRHDVSDPTNPIMQIIPSFHRPALVNYHLNAFMQNAIDSGLISAGDLSGSIAEVFCYPYGPNLIPGDGATERLPWDNTRNADWDDPNNFDPNILQQIVQLKRLIIMRPLPEDHPDFPNAEAFNTALSLPFNLPNTALSQMVWDVDNDGDGVPDSIWIDAGLPVQTSPDGRRYKPMVAILCQDLDSRLNANAHSNQWHRRGYYARNGNLSQAPAPSIEDPAPFAGDVPSYRLLPRGLGVGPADIFLGHLFANGTEHQQFLNVRYADSVASAAGISETDDFLSAVKSLGIPYNYAAEYSAYGMPPDLWGRGAIGLDYNGQPIPIYSGQEGETVGDPYEIVLPRKSAGNVDHPYSLAELERLLRWHDTDAVSLPNRLVGAAPNTFGGTGAQARRTRSLITTHSSHLPVPGGAVPKALRDEFADISATSVLDLYRAALLNGGVDPSNLLAHMEMIVPLEIWHGERFNVNRWFGNGRDDNNNGVVDEPLEAGVDGDGNALPEMVWPSGAAGGFGNNIPFDPPPDPFFGPRQAFARHLFCMMMLVTPGYVHPSNETDLSEIEKTELSVQRLAQWAINVVDFRDSDAIMTPFEYDVNPFNNIPVDWDPRTSDSVDRRIAWGAEYPDLLLTETVAFHNRRVRDTAYDTSGKTISDGDEDPDQLWMPQGSLFLEVYCTRNKVSNNRQFPSELYTNGALDLGRRAPVATYPPADVTGVPGSGATAQISWPVWRVAISEPLEANTGPQDRAEDKPDSTSFNPDDMDLIRQTQDSGVPAPSEDRIVLERVVYFAPGFSYVTSPEFCGDLADCKADLETAAYSPDPRIGGSTFWLNPGGYGVIGPREDTAVSKEDDGQTITLGGAPYPHRILLPRAGGFDVRDNDRQNRYAPPEMPLGIICGSQTPEGRWVGMSVSEPLPHEYYPEPDWPGMDTYASEEDEDLIRESGELSIPVLPDEPLDQRMGPLSDLANDNETFTETDYRAAFLQRLANPLLPFHPATNPYVTVDWATIDLTVFNGEDNPENDDSEDIRFSSRQRGIAQLQSPAPIYGVNYPTEQLTYDKFNLWTPFAQEPAETAESTADTAASLFFKHNLSHTLGFLNGTMGEPLAANPQFAGTPYAGSPQTPFPWLTWNNRPFANPMEMMMVPASTPSRLLHEFGVYRSGETTDDPYDSKTAPFADKFRGTFHHLLNFFHTSDYSRRTGGHRGPGAQVQSGYTGADFYRLFDLVETPSPFVGAEKWYNPDPSTPPIPTFQPPYNHLSRFQDPGRVNINTICDPRVWEGIAKGYPAYDPNGPYGTGMFDRIFRSRRGYDGNLFEFDPGYPTLFGNPFRCADSADLMPRVGRLRLNEPVQATLLREDTLNNDGNPLFVPDIGDVGDVNRPYQDQRRNPFFRYQGLARLGNMVTTQSNVFAVWMTVGYFEVEPNPGNDYSGTGIDLAHPDGYRLGREVGSDSGQIKRHRGFYIIDRSVPVGFEPGENHNIDRAVLLRRFIE